MTIRRKLKAVVTSASVAALLLGGSVVVAAPAQAMSYGQCENVYANAGYHVGRMQYIHYTWWERTFNWNKTPGWVWQQYKWCGQR